jgi:hypothetical protein
MFVAERAEIAVRTVNSDATLGLKTLLQLLPKFVCYAEINRTHMLRLSTEKQFSNSIHYSSEARRQKR